MGIPAEQQQKIFEAFAQADESMARKHGGTGLGLSICTRLVEIMQGRIWVESNVGKGTTFHFTSQWQLGRAAPQQLDPLSRSDLRECAVLIVDDNATNRRVLEGMLSRWGMKPTTVDGGNAALLALDAAARAGTTFGLILLDGQMPEIDGFTMAERIRENPHLIGSTVMMLTSAAQISDAERCRELGVAAYLLKPVRQSELLDSICRVLGQPPAGHIKQGTLPRAEPANTEGRKILIAEDNMVNQTVILSVLEKRGYFVTLVNDGRAAVEAVSRERFDLVLMDVQMPEMDGFQATAAIREKERGTSAHLPIIALTAHALKEDQGKCLASGMDGYLSKPIRTNELFATIRDVLEAGAAAVR